MFRGLVHHGLELSHDSLLSFREIFFFNENRICCRNFCQSKPILVLLLFNADLGDQLSVVLAFVRTVDAGYPVITVLLRTLLICTILLGNHAPTLCRCRKQLSLPEIELGFCHSFKLLRHCFQHSLYRLPGFRDGNNALFVGHIVLDIFLVIRGEYKHLISLQRFSVVVYSNILLCHSLVLSDRISQRAKQ